MNFLAQLHYLNLRKEKSVKVKETHILCVSVLPHWSVIPTRLVEALRWFIFSSLEKITGVEIETMVFTSHHRDYIKFSHCAFQPQHGTATVGIKRYTVSHIVLKKVD
ncbi:hypothetical protein WN51_08433 [Melipona quadrifasciata]|uniref:Uncharacterized protein n=1 Tax=Melipona quadrifasciata TaxID=166423 RepID=A0A0M9AB76_9HYME|nr:hypothetical protein WN51_08433 [Melipona quadrifasciata]